MFYLKTPGVDIFIYRYIIYLNFTGSVPASIFSPLGSPYGITIDILQQTEDSTYSQTSIALLSKTPWDRFINRLFAKDLITNNHKLVLY